MGASAPVRYFILSDTIKQAFSGALCCAGPKGVVLPLHWQNETL
jgi:hypothetical protein